MGGAGTVVLDDSDARECQRGAAGRGGAADGSLGLGPCSRPHSPFRVALAAVSLLSSCEALGPAFCASLPLGEGPPGLLTLASALPGQVCLAAAQGVTARSRAACAALPRKVAEEEGLGGGEHRLLARSPRPLRLERTVALPP